MASSGRGSSQSVPHLSTPGRNGQSIYHGSEDLTERVASLGELSLHGLGHHRHQAGAAHVDDLPDARCIDAGRPQRFPGTVGKSVRMPRKALRQRLGGQGCRQATLDLVQQDAGLRISAIRGDLAALDRESQIMTKLVLEDLGQPR